MRNKGLTKVTAGLMAWTLLFTTLAFGQEADDAVKSTAAATESASSTYAAYLMEVAATDDVSKSYGQKAAAITKVLSSNAARNAVLIDNSGYARDLVLQSVAARLNTAGGKRLYRVNWNALYSLAKDEAAFDKALKGVLAYIEANKNTTAIYLDDIASFSSETPVFGTKVSTSLYNALSQGKIQIVSAANTETFERQIAGDKRLRSRFEKIEIVSDDDQGFVGDKLSPDLRALVAGADQNRTVRVILQSDDIDNPQLTNVLRRNGVLIADRAEAMNMLIIDLPVRVAEEVAAVQSAKHLSLDKEVGFLGHIEETTGVSLVRTQTTTVLNALGIPITTNYQLDGTGVGIAVVDSGVRNDHRSFVDNSGIKRITADVEFANSNQTDRDEFGHGSHVASLAAGSDGASLNGSDSQYLGNYQGMAPNAKSSMFEFLDRQVPEHRRV